MKLKSILFAASMLAFTTAHTAALAAEHSDDAKAAKPEAEKVEKTDAKKPMKKHNHMQEKTGIPVSEPASGVMKDETKKPVDRHDHMKEKH